MSMYDFETNTTTPVTKMADIIDEMFEMEKEAGRSDFPDYDQVPEAGKRIGKWTGAGIGAGALVGAAIGGKSRIIPGMLGGAQIGVLGGVLHQTIRDTSVSAKKYKDNPKDKRDAQLFGPAYVEKRKAKRELQFSKEQDLARLMDVADKSSPNFNPELAQQLSVEFNSKYAGYEAFYELMEKQAGYKDRMISGALGGAFYGAQMGALGGSLSGGIAATQDAYKPYYEQSTDEEKQEMVKKHLLRGIGLGTLLGAGVGSLGGYKAEKAWQTTGRGSRSSWDEYKQYRNNYEQAMGRYRVDPKSVLKDYGVDAGAIKTKKEITDLRRNLAKQYHPDINKASDAATKMQKANADIDALMKTDWYERLAHLLGEDFEKFATSDIIDAMYKEAGFGSAVKKYVGDVSGANVAKAELKEVASVNRMKKMNDKLWEAGPANDRSFFDMFSKKKKMEREKLDQQADRMRARMDNAHKNTKDAVTARDKARKRTAIGAGVGLTGIAGGVGAYEVSKQAGYEAFYNLIEKMAAAPFMYPTKNGVSIAAKMPNAIERKKLLGRGRGSAKKTEPFMTNLLKGGSPEERASVRSRARTNPIM